MQLPLCPTEKSDNMITKKKAVNRDMLVSFDYMTISIYVLRVGRDSKEWRVAYGLVTPDSEKMAKPNVTGSTQLGSCAFGQKSERLSVRKIIWSGERHRAGCLR